MFEALYIGATGMRGQQAQIDAIAQNVANVNTIGYRRNTVSFSDVASAIADPSSNGLTDVAARVVGAGALPATLLSLVAGELKQTGDPMNVAIDGQGFFEVVRADGTPAYTRAGLLQVNADGLLACADGSPLAARVAIPGDAREVRIAPDGTVSALLGDATEPTELGRIELATFANGSGLRSIGDNYYVATLESGEPIVAAPGSDAMGLLRQGALESSNVQMSDEIVNLMLAQRAFELNSKIIQAADQMLGITNGLYR